LNTRLCVGIEGTILHSSVAKDENMYMMVTELLDTIEIRHTITRSFVRYTFVTYLLTYFDVYDHLGYTKTD